MKKLLLYGLISALLISMMPTIALAGGYGAKEKERPIAYEVTGGFIYYDRNREAIVDCDDSVTEAIIPEEIEGREVTRIDEEAFYRCEELVHVEIPETVREIEGYAFESCTRLEEITLPASLEYFGPGSFWDCGSLKNIYVEEENERYSSFDGILYDKGQEEILCYPCGRGETSFTIPEGTIEIGESAFGSCRKLQEIIIPESVKVIGWGAFEHCSGLTSIYIPSSVRTIIGSAFNACQKLTDILVSEENPYFSSSDGILFNKKGTKICIYPAGKTAESYSIPNGVTTIGDYAFSGCYRLKNILIPDSVRTIEESALQDCDGLTELVIPDSVVEIGEAALSWCANLQKVMLPEGLEELEYSVLEGNQQLTSVYIPETVTEIDDFAFYRCGKLKEIDLPDAVATIGESAFRLCTHLEKIELPDSLTHIGEEAFQNCIALKTVVFNDNLLEIESNAFRECDSLEAVKLPEGIEKVGTFAFEECDNLKSVTIPGSLKKIDYYTFGYCDALESVVIEEGVTEIQTGAFGDDPNLEKLFIPSSVTVIHTSAFASFSEQKLREIQVDAKNSNYSSVDGVLYNKKQDILIYYPCGRSEEMYTVPDGVTAIDEECFGLGSCTLTSISLPSSLTYIGTNVTDYCEELTDVYFRGTKEQWEKVSISDLFLGNEKLQEVTMHFQSEGEESIQEILNNIGSKSVAQIRKEVQAIDRDELRQAMEEDVDDTGVNQRLKELDEAAGEVVIQVEDEVTEINESEVSIIGAALNDTDSDVITLDIDEPKNEANEVPEQYSPSRTVSFSMTLEGVVHPKSLEVPVKLSLPIPSKIDPEALVVLHFNDDGKTFEEISINVGKKDEKWYVSFILDGFSDFVMTQEGSDPEVLIGDVNRDGKVTNKDRTELSRYLAKWNGYDENRIDLKAADVNGDGKVTNKDRTILSRYLAKWKGYDSLPYQL